MRPNSELSTEKKNIQNKENLKYIYTNQIRKIVGPERHTHTMPYKKVINA